MYQGKLVRPFSTSAEVGCRQYSKPLERVITDFGSDESFEHATKKLEEHYGISISRSSARNTTLKHASTMSKQKKAIHRLYQKPSKSSVIIAEADGTMIPIVHTTEGQTDRRKNKTLVWQESRLSLAYSQGTIQPFYEATLGSTDVVGKQLAHCAKMVGRAIKTKIHCVGDGAPWIAEQVDKVFGDTATYLIDFYHLSEYIAAAATCCAANEQKAWVSYMQSCMKENRSSVLLKALEDHIAESYSDHLCEARKCYNYIIKRTNQIDYKGAMDNNLPIGSGRIESGHRSVIQKRLKKPGAWWKKKNAEYMLTLRTIRANGLWDNYWRP